MSGLTKTRSAGRLAALIFEDMQRLFNWLKDQWWIWPAAFVASVVELVAIFASAK
jgi:hypothetical protein